MRFLENVNAEDMGTLRAVRETCKEVVRLYVDYLWASYNNGDSFDRVFKGYEKYLDELEPIVCLEADRILFLKKEGINKYEYDLDFIGTDYGDCHTVVRWGYDNSFEIEMTIDGKEMDDFEVFDWRIGCYVWSLVVKALIRKELDIAFTVKTEKM